LSPNSGKKEEKFKFSSLFWKVKNSIADKPKAKTVVYIHIHQASFCVNWVNRTMDLQAAVSKDDCASSDT
jgi:hypothetical protein